MLTPDERLAVAEVHIRENALAAASLVQVNNAVGSMSPTTPVRRVARYDGGPTSQKTAGKMAQLKVMAI